MSFQEILRISGQQITVSRLAGLFRLNGHTSPRTVHTNSENIRPVSPDTPRALQVVLDIYHTGNPLSAEKSFSDLVENIKDVELEFKDPKTSKIKKVSSYIISSFHV